MAPHPCNAHARKRVRPVASECGVEVEVQLPADGFAQGASQVESDQAVEEAGADPGGADRAVRVEVCAVARPADIGEERESRGGERCRDLGAAASEPLAA